MRMYGRRHWKREFMRTLKLHENKIATNSTLTPIHNDVLQENKGSHKTDCEPPVSLSQTVEKTHSLVEPFDLLTGVQFKNLIGDWFANNGFIVEKLYPRINSIDFILKKDNLRIAVAIKHTFDLIRLSYVKNVIESAHIYEVDSIYIITNSISFMSNAKKLAEENGITVWVHETLKRQLGE